jgi:hypothetical protein
MTSLSRPLRPILLASVALACFVSQAAHAQAAPAAAPAATGKRVYVPADFARYAPKNALDMLRQVPGFTILQAVEERGLGQASENVLLNGQRISNKSGGAVGELEKTPAANVERIEIVNAATLDIAGLNGQVANIIVKAEKKASGQFSWRPEFRAHFTDPILTRGDVSYSGKQGPIDYNVGLNSGGNRSGAGGPTTIFDSADVPFEFRDDAWRSNYDNPKLSGRFTYDPVGASVGSLNLSYMPHLSSYHEDSSRTRPDGVDRTRAIRQKARGSVYEVGGDYSFSLGPGQLKLIGLRKVDHEPVTTTAIFDFADGSPSTGDRVKRDGRTGEWIGRGEYGWKIGRSDFQITGEAAFNTLDSETRIFLLDPVGDFSEIPFPEGTGEVREDRFEMLGTWGRPLSKSLELQVVAGGEYSKLSSESSIGGQTRTFFRPKGSASLSWKASEDLNLSLKLRRRVGQLNFYDFLASVNLTDDRENAGNIDLVPPQSWELDIEANQKLGAWGTTSLRLYGRLIDDIVDIVPIGLDGESPGNIDRAHRYGFEWKSTINFDPLGWRGAKLDSTVILQHSAVKDPLTGEKRSISDTAKRVVELELRHDIPTSDWAWGGSIYHDKYSPSFRLTEVGRMWEGPIWIGAFVENKNVAGLTVRASVNNISNARSRWDRIVYTGFRTTNPVAFREHRNRLIGPIFSLSVRGNF